MLRPILTPPTPDQRRLLASLANTHDAEDGRVLDANASIRTLLERGGWISYAGRSAGGDKTYRLTDTGREILCDHGHGR